MFPARIRFRPRLGALRATEFTVVLVFAIFVAAIGWIYFSTTRESALQQNIRAAEAARTDALALQTNEENGLRGFTGTGLRLFLRPLAQARIKAPRVFASLLAAVRTIDVSSAPVRREGDLHARWEATVAAPSMQHPASDSGHALALRGKALVDRFRAQDALLQTAIDARAADADVQTIQTIRQVGLLSLFVAIAVTLLLLYDARKQDALGRQLVERTSAYENEKRIADALQKAFLNTALPAESSVAFHAIYMPAGSELQVGGDWYDVAELPDGRTFFSVGDVAGHGLAAAITMNRARQAIFAAALHERDPAAVLERANAVLLVQDSVMTTAICGYIDPATFAIRYASAGHPPPVLASDAETRFLPHSGIPLGIDKAAVFETIVAEGYPGALVVLYTDGVTEGTRDTLSGEAQLLMASQTAAREKTPDPAAQIHQLIFQNRAPLDDVAILTVSFGATAASSQAPAR